MAGVLEDDDLSVEDALAYNEALLQAEEAYRKGPQSTDVHLRPGQANELGSRVESAISGQAGNAGFDQNRTASLRELLVDIEDVGLQLDRKAIMRQNGLYVTDFSAAEWCQQQVAFSLGAQIPKHLTETDAMRAGTRHHAELEAETAGVVVEVAIQTREDAFAMRLLNMHAGLQQLLTSGLTRELPICGILQGCWISGVIDQLELTADGLIRVSEQKTRFQPSLPSECQKRTTAVQVMMYRQLLLQLSTIFGGNDLETVLSLKRLNPKQELSETISQHAGLSEKATLSHIVQGLQRTLEFLPTCHDISHVNYIWQGDGLLLEQEEVPFDAKLLEETISRHLHFWNGVSAPTKVPQDEQWKCRNCTFNTKCWPALKKIVPWQH